MKELATMGPDRFRADWDSPPIGDDPHQHLCEYIISPTPLPDDLFDEGGCD